MIEPGPERGISISESDAAEHLREKHLQMIMDAQQAGRRIPAVPVSESLVGRDLARTAVEASQRSMRRATKRSFIIPALPWQRAKEHNR